MLRPSPPGKQVLVSVPGLAALARRCTIVLQVVMVMVAFPACRHVQGPLGRCWGTCSPADGAASGGQLVQHGSFQLGRLGQPACSRSTALVTEPRLLPLQLALIQCRVYAAPAVLAPQLASAFRFTFSDIDTVGRRAGRAFISC